MALTYEKIATNTLGSAAASVTFSSIPATYTDIVIIGKVKQTSGGGEQAIRFNGDTGSNYSCTIMEAYGSSPNGTGSFRESNQTSGKFGYQPKTSFNNFTVQVINYNNSTTFKTSVCESGTGDGVTTEYVNRGVVLYRSTSVINALTIIARSNNYDTGSIFTLYGIKEA